MPRIIKPKTRKDFKGNVWRHLLADAIEANCGYSSGYHARFALSWNVSVDWGIPDFDDMLKRALAPGNDYGFSPDDPMDPELLAQFEQEWQADCDGPHFWYSIVEDMRSGVTDADTYRTLRPEIAARYGLPGSQEAMPKQYKRRSDECAYYPASKDGWIKVDPYRNILYFDVEWEFAGRQGKHLCLAEFEDRRLNMTSDDLAEAIRNDSDSWGRGSYPNEWCQKLLAFIHECDLCFDHKMVKVEFEHEVDFRFQQGLRDVVDASAEKIKEAAERLAWEERDVMTEES